MKLTYRTEDGRIQFELEVENGKSAFEAVASIDELFAPESCGCCESSQTRYEVREFDGNKYFKRLCTDCGAVLDYGQHKDGKGLFAKRFDSETRAARPNRGWYVWQRGDAHADEGGHQPQTREQKTTMELAKLSQAYAQCANPAQFAKLEDERRALWTQLTGPQQSNLKAISEQTKRRLAPAPAGTV